MKSGSVLIYLFSLLLLSLSPTSVYGDQSSQDINDNNQCPTQIRGNYNRVTCTPSINSDTPSSNPRKPSISPLSSEELEQKCRNGSFPKTILNPIKEEYFETESIIVEYANACPNKTSLVIKLKNSPTNGMNTGHLKRRSIVREYAGELSLDKSSLRKGAYEIHAYFEADPTDVRVQYNTGVSKAFKIVSRI